MASAEVRTDKVARMPGTDIFEETTSLIHRKFGHLVDSLNKRRDELLSKLRRFKLEWERKTEKHFLTIQKLESMKAGIEALCIKDNQISHVHDATLKPVLQELSILKRKVEQPNILLICDTQQIMALIDELGKFQVTDPEKCSITDLQGDKPDIPVPPAVAALNAYKGRNKPTVSIEIPHNFPRNKPQVRKLFFSRASQSIFVVSDSEHVVLVFTVEGRFVTEFGRRVLQRPCGIFAEENLSFVIDEKLGMIYRFITDKDIPLKKIAPNNFVPKGIDGDTKQCLYIIDSVNNNICVYDFSLNWIRDINISNSIEHPLEIQLCNDAVFLLSADTGDYCIHVFSNDGQKLHSLISRDCLQDIGAPRHFSIDSFGNFILTESMDSRIKVFSYGGDFCCAIGEKSGATPQAVCIANDRVVSATPSGSICLY